MNPGGFSSLKSAPLSPMDKNRVRLVRAETLYAYAYAYARAAIASNWGASPFRL